jgi:hypothetical protein
LSPQILAKLLLKPTAKREKYHIACPEQIPDAGFQMNQKGFLLIWYPVTGIRDHMFTCTASHPFRNPAQTGLAMYVS